MFIKVYNPTSKRINLSLEGEKVDIGVKGEVFLEMKVGNALQELLPGLEYIEVEGKPIVEKPVVEKPIKHVTKRTRTSKKKYDKSK